MPESSTGHIFISYATANLEGLMPIVEQLEARGQRCWLADRDLPKGTPDWGAALSEAVVTCDCFVLTISKASNASSYVTNEVIIAVENNKPVLVVRIEAVRPSPSRRVHIASIQELDVFGMAPEFAAAKILGALPTGTQPEPPRHRPRPIPVGGGVRSRPFTTHSSGARTPALMLAAVLLVLGVVGVLAARNWQAPSSSAYAKTAAPMDQAQPPAADNDPPIGPDSDATSQAGPERHTPRAAPKPKLLPHFFSANEVFEDDRFTAHFDRDRLWVLDRDARFGDYFTSAAVRPSAELQAFCLRAMGPRFPLASQAQLQELALAGHAASAPWTLDDSTWQQRWIFALPEAIIRVPLGPAMDL